MGKGKKVTIPSYQALTPIPPGFVHGHDRSVEYFRREEKEKRKRKKHVEALVKVAIEQPVGQSSVVSPPSLIEVTPPLGQQEEHQERVKKRKLKKEHQVPSILEVIPEGVEEEEDDLEDTIPLSQRTRLVVIGVEETKKNEIPSSPMT